MARHLDQAPVWHALLHLRRGVPSIKDPGFLLSLGHFSPREELLATMAHLYGPDSTSAVCRFPARYAWLREQAELPELPLDSCQTLSEFLSRAPTTSLSLVFASENLSQPSSMMGHLFLKASGLTSEGRKVEHAISFFTDTATANIPKLFYDSMVTGKKGYFALTPYQDEIRNYVVQEQRTLWEYELQLDPRTLDLLRLHIHELRLTDITYFFQSYNCASLVEDILAIAAPSVLDHEPWWTTPKDVLREAATHQLLKTATVKTPSRWRVRNLQDTLDQHTVHTVQHAMEEQDLAPFVEMAQTNAPSAFLATELGRAYNTYLFEQQAISLKNWQTSDEQLKEIEAAHFANLELHTDASKDPSRSPMDKQVSLGWAHRKDRKLLKLGLLPVSHTLADDNRQYNNENELRLFDTAMLVDVDSGRLALDHLTIYGTRSLLPRDPMTGGMSGGFKIGFENQPDRALNDRATFQIEGELGGTWRPVPDIDLFALMGGGWGYRAHGYIYAKPTVGLLVREVFDMKTMLSVSQHTRPLGTSGRAVEWRVTQSKFMDAQNTLVLDLARTMRAGQGGTQLAISYKHLF